MTKKNFDAKVAKVDVAELADMMADNFTALVDGDKAIFEVVKKKDGTFSVDATVENVNDVDYRATMSFERFAYSRERYIRTYLPKAIRHAMTEALGTGVKVKVTTKADMWSLSSLKDDENGLTYNVDFELMRVPNATPKCSVETSPQDLEDVLRESKLLGTVYHSLADAGK